MMQLLVTSGMRSGELRALKWGDVTGILITKAMKDEGRIEEIWREKTLIGMFSFRLKTGRKLCGIK